MKHGSIKVAHTAGSAMIKFLTFMPKIKLLVLDEYHR